MDNAFSRTELLIGKDKLDKLSSFHVAIFGLGGVGGYACEALARIGISNFTLIDNDVISLSNLNRQIIATRETVGRKKVYVMKERIISINPNAIVNCYDLFFLNNNDETIDFSKFDYVIDCIDTISAKLSLCEICDKYNIKIISSMGTGNKLIPHFEVGDINNTSTCPLAKVMRRELKKRNIKKLKVVYSKEQPIKPLKEVKINKDSHKLTPGSISFVPPACGLVIASEVFKDLIKE